MIPDPRNQNLNAAYWPTGPTPNVAPSVMVPQGNTQFDPLAGSGWGSYLDQLGASDPGGMAMKGLVGSASPTALAQSNLPSGTVQGAAPGAISPSNLAVKGLAKAGAKKGQPPPAQGQASPMMQSAIDYYNKKYPGATS